MNNLVQKIVIQCLLFITAVLFGLKFVELDLIALTNPLISIFTWTMVTMAITYDFNATFKIKDKRIVPAVKAGISLLILLGMWRTGNTNDIIVALSLASTGILAVFVISVFFDTQDINLIDKTTRYVSALTVTVLVFDIVTGYAMSVNRHNNHMVYFWFIVASQVVNRINIEILVYNLSKNEQCKSYFSERKRAIKFGVESVVQSGFYICMFLLISTTIESQLLSLFPEFKIYEILLCVVIATSVIASHSVLPKKLKLLTVISNIKWAATFSIRMLLLYFTILLVEDFSFEYILILLFIFAIVTLFTKFISTNWMSTKSYKVPSYILYTFMGYIASLSLTQSEQSINYSDLRIVLNMAFIFLFISYTLHKVYKKHKSHKIFRIESVVAITTITISLSVIANTIIFGFAISASDAMSSVGLEDFGADDISFAKILLLSGSAIIAYIPARSKNVRSTIILTTIKWLGIMYIFNFVITKAAIISTGLEIIDYVTIIAAIISIIIARGISENRIKFGWVVAFGLVLVFAIEFVYMAVNFMGLFGEGEVNFNGFRMLYATYFALTAFAYIYIRNIRIGRTFRVYWIVRLTTSILVTSMLFIATVWGKPAPNMFDLSNIDPDILEEVMGGIMEEFPNVDWCEILDESGIGDEIGLNCGNYVVLPEEESHQNSFRDGVATVYDPHTGEWNIDDSYGSVMNSSGQDHSTHESYDYQSVMNDPAILSNWFTVKTNYEISLEVPFGSVRNTIPTTMYSDLLSTSIDMGITSDQANTIGISNLRAMDYTIDYRVLNSVGEAGFVDLLNSSSGNTNSITSGYIEVPTSMNTLINQLVSEYQGLSIGQASGDYNVINAIAAFINTKYNVSSGLPSNPSAMTITDLENFRWYDNSPIEDQIQTGSLTYSSAVSLQTLMASRLGIKTRISNQLVPMLSEDGEPGLFPLGVPRIEVAANTPSGGVWTDVTVATPVPSNNSGVIVSGLSQGEDVFLRRDVVDTISSDATFTNHNPTDYFASNGFVYGETPYGSAGISTNDVTFNVTYNPLFTSPMELFTYGTQSYNGSSNGIDISSMFGTAEQSQNIPEIQVHQASLAELDLNATLKQLAQYDYDEVMSSDGSTTTIDNSDVENIARDINSRYSINESDDPTVIQIITQARINTNNYIDAVLNNNNSLKEKYSANQEAFIDAIFVHYNRLLGIDLRIVSGFTANQNGTDALDANPSHMFELYVDDSDEKWIPLPTYIQSSMQAIASTDSQDLNNDLVSIIDTIDGQITGNDNYDDFSYIGKRNADDETVSLMVDGSIDSDLGVVFDITASLELSITDPIFNDNIFGHSFKIIEGGELLSNITDTSFIKVASGTVEIEVFYNIPSTGERVSKLFEIKDSGFIPVSFEPIDIENMDKDQINNTIGNIYDITNTPIGNTGHSIVIYAYAGTSINYCSVIDYIYFPGTNQPNESANIDNLTGIDDCEQEAVNSVYTGTYSGTINGIDYTDLVVDFKITTITMGSDLGGGSNTSTNLAVYEGEKFDMRTFLEHHEIVGVEVGSIWIDNLLLASDEFIFETNQNGSSKVIEINFEIEGKDSTNAIPTENSITITVMPANVIVNSIHELNDALNGDALDSSLASYATISEPNATIAYVDSNGTIASSHVPGNTAAPWFINHDRHNVNYDLSITSSLQGIIDGNSVNHSNTIDEALMFAKGVWQNLNINDINNNLSDISLDVDVILNYGYKTDFSYSVDGIDFNRERSFSSSNNFNVVDDKIVLTVNENNRTPNELTTISGSGWVFKDKLGRDVSFTVDAVSSDGTVTYTNDEFVFGELSADFTQGHEFRIHATSTHSGITTEDNPVFMVELNEIDVDNNNQIDNYYVGYIYDISSILNITNWNGLNVTNSSSIEWSVAGGSTFNPTNYSPEIGYTDLVATITYAQRVKVYDLSFNIKDKVADNTLPVVDASDDMDPVVTTGSNLEFNFTFTEEEALFGDVNICDEFFVTDIVNNSSLGQIIISNTGDCTLSDPETTLDTLEWNLLYQQRYGPELNIKVNITREESIFDVSSIASITSIYHGRTIRLSLTYYKNESGENYFLDDSGVLMTLPESSRDYVVGQRVKFIFEVSTSRLFNLEVVGEEADFEVEDMEYSTVPINSDLSSNLRFNKAEFSLVEREGVWYIQGTDILFDEFNKTFFDSKMTAYDGQVYNIEWIFTEGEVYIVSFTQTYPPSMLIFYIILALMGSGLIYLIIYKLKNKKAENEENRLITKIKKKIKANREKRTKGPILINKLIMKRVHNLFEVTSEKSNVVKKGNMTWREYCNRLSAGVENADKEEWESLADIVDRCAYYKESLNWIHFNYVETLYQKTFKELGINDDNKTKKY